MFSLYAVSFYVSNVAGGGGAWVTFECVWVWGSGPEVKVRDRSFSPPTAWPTWIPPLNFVGAYLSNLLQIHYLEHQQTQSIPLILLFEYFNEHVQFYRYYKWKICYKNSIYFGLLVHFQECNLYYINSTIQRVQYKLYSWKWTNSPKYIEFYNKFFIFCGTLPSDSLNFIRLLWICSIKYHHQHPFLFLVIL
jgi:hypothetical protein